MAVAYAAPIILLPLWLILKLVWFFRGNGWGFVKIDADVGRLAETLQRLRYKKRDETVQTEETGHKGYMMANVSRTDDGNASNMLSSTVSPVTEVPPYRPVSPVEQSQHHYQHSYQPQQHQQYIQTGPHGAGHAQQGYM